MAAFNATSPINPQNFTVTPNGVPINRQVFDVLPPAEPLAAPTSDLALKTPVRAATTGSNITLSGLQTIDGVVLAAGDRVLVKDQTDATTNGIYNVQTGPWTRALDANSSLQWAQGLAVLVTQGTTNLFTIWIMSAVNPITLGTTNLRS